MVLNAIPRNNGVTGAIGSNSKIHTLHQARPAGRGVPHLPFSPAFTLQSRLAALTQNFSIHNIIQ